VSDFDPIARALALGCWTAPDKAELLQGGITNHNVKLTDDGADYVVRLGADIPEHMILRWHEKSLSEAAHATGVAPGVVHHEEGVLVLRYVEARPLQARDLHDPATLLGAVDLVKRLHNDGIRNVTGPLLSFWVFHILRTYAAFLQEHRSPHCTLLAPLLEEADGLEGQVGAVSLVLAHNDLLPANILAGKDRMWLIDWEYGGLNSPLFDLGGLATNAGLTPDLEEAMLAHYFDQAPDADLITRYTAMKCASLLRETMWSMVSELTSTLDFDYAGYTASNLDTYRTAYSAFTSGPQSHG